MECHFCDRAGELRSFGVVSFDACDRCLASIERDTWNVPTEILVEVSQAIDALEVR